MRARELMVITVAAGSLLVACTSSGSDGGSPYCRRLSAAAQRITAAESDLYGDTGRATSAMHRLVTELDGLQADAPARIKATLTDLGQAFQTAQGLLQHPDPAASAQLAAVAKTLQRDGKQLTDYATSKCR
jgi:hypothetical protein